MNILLIYSNDNEIARYKKKRVEFPPMGLLYLAGAIDRNIHNIEIVDLEELNNTCMPTYDIVGLSINTAYSFISFCKKKDKINNIANYLIVGGQFSTINYKDIFIEFPKTKALIRGEGENVINEVINKINSNSIDSIKGVVTPANICTLQKILRIDDLNRINIPARDLIDDSLILLNHRIPDSDDLSICILTSRGCPYRCVFCGNLYKSIYYRSREKIKEELIFLLNRYCISHITILDENLMYNEEHLYTVCDLLKEFNLLWSCNSRVDSYSPDKIQKMKSAGCIEIKYGIESGDESILKLMKKDITIDKIKKAIIGTKENGIPTKGFLMYGFPSESINSIKNTISLLEELKPFLNRVNLFNFVPLHNSDCYNNPHKYGIKLNNNYNDFSFYNHLQHWWGTEDEYKTLVENRKIIEEYIKNNFSRNEPINKTKK